MNQPVEKQFAPIGHEQRTELTCSLSVAKIDHVIVSHERTAFGGALMRLFEYAEQRRNRTWDEN